MFIRARNMNQVELRIGQHSETESDAEQNCMGYETKFPARAEERSKNIFY